MDAHAVPLLTIFEKKMRLEVPLFQRQYVWSRDQQWEPLWEDITRKFIEHLDGRKDAPVHFLGAMVLDQKLTPSTHVERRQVIDGQQRLTTLQIFIAALRDFCREKGCEDLGKECDGFTLNRGMMAQPDIDRFKVWPTQLDREQFFGRDPVRLARATRKEASGHESEIRAESQSAAADGGSLHFLPRPAGGIFPWCGGRAGAARRYTASHPAGRMFSGAEKLASGRGSKAGYMRRRVDAPRPDDGTVIFS